MRVIQGVNVGRPKMSSTDLRRVRAIEPLLQRSVVVGVYGKPAERYAELLSDCGCKRQHGSVLVGSDTGGLGSCSMPIAGINLDAMLA